jgi:hypothetical protein
MFDLSHRSCLSVVVEREPAQAIVCALRSGTQREANGEDEYRRERDKHPGVGEVAHGIVGHRIT